MKLKWVKKLIVPSAIAKLAVAVGIATFAFACGNNNTAVESSLSNCQSLKHDRGETKVCDTPQKIVAIGPNMLELLLALDIQPVGYADYFSLPAKKFDRPSQQIPFLGERITNQPLNVGNADDPNLETIAQLQPDLILGGVASNQDEYDLLSQIAPTLLFTYAVDEQWQEQIRLVAQAVGKTESVEQVIAKYTKNIAQNKEALQPIAAKHPKVLLIGSESIEQGVQVDPYNHDSYCSGLIETLGFTTVSPPNKKGQEGQGGKVSLELLPQMNADLIVVQGYNSDFNNIEGNLLEHQTAAIKQQWNNNAIAQSLPPSKSDYAPRSLTDRVYFTSAYLCRALPGPIGAEIFLNQFEEQLLRSDL